MRYFVTIDGHEQAIEVRELPGGAYDVRFYERADDHGDGEPIDAEVLAKDGMLALRIGDRVLDLVVDGDGQRLDVFASGRRSQVSVESTRTRAAGELRKAQGGGGDGVVLSPMPGKVVKVLVEEGQHVEIGTPLVVVEAMKMENELAAERAGVIQKVFVAPGDAVEGGAKLVTVG